MITICIPVYNFNISSLINELSNQKQLASVQIEIILIDDCSDDFYKTINKQACKNHTYIELPENIGRAKIRNLFLTHATFEYLLFLDCDSLITSPSFLSKYLEIIKENPLVVCGGRIYDHNKPPRDKRLRWKYGVLRESQPCAIRRKFPNKSFMTNNFLIKREVLEQNKFDERIVHYGHEDTLFGYELKKRNIAITHIENPVINGDVESNVAYLTKTREGIMNLIQIVNFTATGELFNDITLLKTYHKTRKAENLVRIAFRIIQPLLTFLLTRGYVSLFLFDFYKLGFFIENTKQNTIKHFE